MVIDFRRSDMNLEDLLSTCFFVGFFVVVVCVDRSVMLVGLEVIAFVSI